MELFGIGIGLLLLFISFGFMVGVLFGFFGMGGAFLITPTLLILDYPARVAIGTGLAFYFGTSVIAVMKHYDIGHVDYKLGAVMFIGLTLGIEGGSILVFGLERLGIAELVTGIAYVLLLAAIGLIFLRRARNVDDDGTDDDDDESHDDDIPPSARKLQSYNVPPMISLSEGGKASLWTISGVGGVVELVSGFLGVGGGFIRMPAIYYLIGTPLAVAVGTSLFAGLFSGAFGAFTYGMAGGVDLAIITPLLIGSALGARIGSAATTSVNEDDVLIYFALMMLLASLAIGLRQLANWLDIGMLNVVSVVLLVGSAFAVGSVVLYHLLKTVRTAPPPPEPTPSND